MKFTLTAIALCASFIAPAYATPTVTALFAAIKATGTSIVVDGEQCNNKTLMGHYTYVKDVRDQMDLCVANHKGDSAELYDTILHEAVHVVQACKGDNLFTYASIIKAATPDEIQFIATTYPQAQFNRELEARVIAREWDEVYVTNLIKEHCK